MYLSWHNKAPRQHHMNMALHVLSYLYYTASLPLVLGGSSELQVLFYSDASFGTAPKGRCVLGRMGRLGMNSGAIMAQSVTSTVVHGSSFEAELDGVSGTIKRLRRVVSVMEELGINVPEIPVLYSDNQAMIEFVKGNGVAKGVRHMELRMWYVREKYKEGRVILNFMAGLLIPPDKLTKVAATIADHKEFTREVMGLKLLDDFIL